MRYFLSVAVHTEDLAGSNMISADADNALSAVLNGDNPPTKMFVFGTKARDDEAKRTMVLDFDGRVGRVSDPVFEPGQVSGVDDILFNSDMTEEELASEDEIYNPKIEDSDDDIIFPDESKVAEESQDTIDFGDDDLNELLNIE